MAMHLATCNSFVLFKNWLCVRVRVWNGAGGWGLGVILVWSSFGGTGRRDRRC